jgi:hypothetical protein
LVFIAIVHLKTSSLSFGLCIAWSAQAMVRNSGSLRATSADVSWNKWLYQGVVAPRVGHGVDR